jgi:hypothetical protein
MKIAIGILLALAVLVALVAAGMLSRRSSLRREFREYLAEKRPDLTVVQESGGSFVLRDSQGNDVGTVYLHRIYREAPDELAARTEMYDKLIATVSEGSALEHLGPADRERVLPRIVNRRFLADLPRELPAVPLGAGGLSVIFVLDSPNSVAYLDRDLLGKLDLDPSTALDLAKRNLDRTFGRETVRNAVDEPSLNVVKALDTYDAARLLLVQQHLEPGEAVVALIPDRDTLVLTHPPADNDWKALRKLGKSADGEPLYGEPLVVTSEGISEAPASPASPTVNP